MTIVLRDPVFRDFRDFIYEKCGIFIPDTKKYLLENRLVKRIEDKCLSGFEDYLKYLRYSTNGDELSRLYDAITTNETYFFREPQQLDVFIDQIAPKVLSQKKAKDIRIWSAACSTGEEAYTLIMMLAEKIAGVRTEILGSDISDEVLASARRGVYNSYSIRNVPEPYMKKYFRDNGQMNFELDAAVKRPVTFSNINLIDEKKIRTIGSFDVIFCRNVLIYFDDKAKQKVVSFLYNSLKPGGYLFVGSSESLHSVTRAFRPVIINKVVVYQRG
ncbi:MAG: protein-glutamate O-methyltransferase CheR [Nitrospiraceae bacterium]|nr:protein-glutamate O-methyltransferase CheR [Nitrospiraceae bacterium]